MANFYWTKDIDEARKEQQTLVELVKTKKSTFDSAHFNFGLAIGTSYEENTKTAFAVCIMFDRRGKTIGDCIITKAEVDFPYVPGLLAFRVGSAICLALAQVTDKIDLLLFDGQGIAHPRGFGLASHIGVLFDKPSVGVTKKALFGNYTLPTKGIHHTDLRHPRTNVTIGYCVSTSNSHDPFFMSPGHRITLSESLEFIKMIAGDSYLPDPLRIVHVRANRLVREYWDKQKKTS